MDVALPKETYKRPGSETPGQQEATADTARQKQLRRALQKSAVLFEAGHETETRAQGSGVRTRTLVEPYMMIGKWGFWHISLKFPKISRNNHLRKIF